jgi:hypothetical protein
MLLLNNSLTNLKFTKSTIRLEDYIVYIIHIKFYKNLKPFNMLLKLVKINGIHTFCSLFLNCKRKLYKKEKMDVRS